MMSRLEAIACPMVAVHGGTRSRWKQRKSGSHLDALMPPEPICLMISGDRPTTVWIPVVVTFDCVSIPGKRRTVSRVREFASGRLTQEPPFGMAWRLIELVDL